MASSDFPIPFPVGEDSKDSDTVLFIQIVEGFNFSVFLLSRIFLLPYFAIFLLSIRKLAVLTREIKQDWQLHSIIYLLIIISSLIRLQNLLFGIFFGPGKTETVFPGKKFFKGFASFWHINSNFLPSALLIVIHALAGLFAYFLS